MRAPLFLLVAAAALSSAAVAQDLLQVGPHRYQWDASWGRPFEAGAFGAKGEGPVEMGNTHGCMVVRQDGHILVNTDKEHAVVVFSPEGEVVATWGEEFRGGLHGMCHRVEDGKEVLYLAHTRRSEVVKTTVDGKVLWTIGWPEQSGIYKNARQYNPCLLYTSDAADE